MNKEKSDFDTLHKSGRHLIGKDFIFQHQNNPKHIVNYSKRTP